MRSRLWMSLALLPHAAACGAADQPHPLERVGTEVTRSIPAEGGFISTPAGAAVYVAPDAAGPTTFTLEAAPMPGELAASGTLASATAFRLGPAGRSLPEGSRAELGITGAPADSVWLTSVVRLGADGVVEHGASRVDMSLGIASASIDGTGTLAAVTPDRGAVVALSPDLPDPPAPRPITSAETLMLLSIDSLTVNCGGPSNRCAGLRVAASDNLLGRVGRAALVYPRLNGVLRREGSDVVGTVAVDAAFRVEMASGATAENVTLSTTFPVRATLVDPALVPAGAPLLSTDPAGGERITFYPPTEHEPARAVIERTIQVPDAAGVLEPARIYISFPFEVHSR